MVCKRMPDEPRDRGFFDRLAVANKSLHRREGPRMTFEEMIAYMDRLADAFGYSDLRINDPHWDKAHVRYRERRKRLGIKLSDQA